MATIVAPQDVTGRPWGQWIIHFGVDMPQERAALYEQAHEHVLRRVREWRQPNPARRTVIGGGSTWSRGRPCGLPSLPYHGSSCFETFPFPWPPGQEPADDPRVQAIAVAARELVASRERWLSPPGASETELRRRTLTNLYNSRPTWLDNLHCRLDEAVLAAYGWPSDLTDTQILKHLLDLNLSRPAADGPAAGEGEDADKGEPVDAGEVVATTGC